MSSEPLKPKDRPACTCAHSYQQHLGGKGPCCFNNGNPMSPGYCWCSSYEPNDTGRLLFPVEPLPQPE